MSFSPTTIKQLYRELAYHQKRAAMLYELLAEVEPPKVPKQRRRAVDPSSARGPQVLPVMSSTFRETLGQLISERPGITRNALIDLLKSGGVQSAADTTFDIRLDNELRHMVQCGHITRTFKGGYLPEEAA